MSTPAAPSVRREWKHEERARELPAGPWDDEPDKVYWIDPTTGLDCLIHRNSLGALCGYVGVPPGHPAHGKGYDDVAVDVHGGLTYADACEETTEEGTGICHVPLEGRPAHVWWLGFDCAHYRDLVPSMVSAMPPTDGRYRDIAYVEAEVTRLAEQLAAPVRS